MNSFLASKFKQNNLSPLVSKSNNSAFVSRRKSNFIDAISIKKFQDKQINFSQFNKIGNSFNSLLESTSKTSKSHHLRSGQLNNDLKKSIRLTNRILNFRDILRCIALVLIVFMSSLTIIFDNVEWSQMWFTSYTIILLFCLFADLFLIYFYGVQYQGQYASSIKSISLYLVKEKWFTLLIPLLAFTLFCLTGMKYKFFLICIFPGLKEIQYIIKSIGERIFKSIRLLYILKLLNLFLLILFFAHSFACFWIYVPSKINTSNNWLIKYQLYDQAWSIQYVNALYYITISMVTVGYGDIAPTNTEEKILCSILIVLLCGIYGYSLNQIGVIFNELNKNSISIQQKKIYINKFMLRKNVSENLQNRIREYLDYYWEKKFDDDTQEEGLKIIQQLNSNLKKQLIFESNNLVIRDSPIFASNFSPQLLSKMTQIITEQKYMPEEIIYEKDSSDLNSIFFIEQGEVQIINNSKNKVTVINELTKGNFGYYSFFTGQPREFTTRSKSFSAVLKIDLKPFLELLKEFEEDLEKYYYIRDLINYNNQFDLINQACSECQQTSHQINNCPKIHYCCDRIQLVKSDYSLSSLQIDRDRTFKRQTQRKTGYKSQIVRLLDKYIDFAVTFDITLNEYEDKFLQSYYEKMEIQTPVNAEIEQNQKKDFMQFVSQIAEEQPSEVFSINFDNNEKKKPFISQNTLTQSIQDEQSKKQQLTTIERSHNFDETSIGDNIRARMNSGNVSQSSYNNLQSNKDPNSNINIASKLNQYFFQNIDESPSENNKILRLQSIVRNFDDLQIPMIETPVSRFSKINIKREKSIRSFQRMISESVSIKSKMKNEEKEGSEKKVIQEQQKDQNEYSNMDTEIINPMDESLNYSQISRRKLLKLEYDAMKIMKVYFIRDNYPSIIQKFNLTNRYYSYQMKNKSQIKISSNEQNSKFDSLIDQGERQNQENTFISSQKENQNEFIESLSGIKVLSGSRLFRQSTINIIQQSNNNKSKARSIFRKFIYENRQSQSNNTSFHSSQNENENNNKAEDLESVFKRKSLFKISNKDRNQNSFISQNSNKIQDVENISIQDNNEQKSVSCNQCKDQDQQSEIQDESRINFFPNQQIQNKMILDCSSLSSSRTIQNEVQQSQRSDINKQSDNISKLESDLKIQKDEKNSQRILCKFDSFSDL
ncbi:hypothetical protein ABPG74_003243 [Tetrahymena malaccensis]